MSTRLGAGGTLYILGSLEFDRRRARPAYRVATDSRWKLVKFRLDGAGRWRVPWQV